MIARAAAVILFALGAKLAAAQAPEPAASAAAAPEDPFLGLEDAASPSTQAFFAAQAAKARATLDAIPGRAAMLARIRALSAPATTISSLTQLANGRVFYLRLSADLPQPVLCMRDGFNGRERVLVTAAIDWFVPSPDGRHVALGLATAGGADSVLRVVEVDRATMLPLEIDRARFNEHLAWHPDGRSFYYARIPAGEDFRRRANVRLYRHLLGRDASQDEVVFAPGVGGARDVPEFVRPYVVVLPESKAAYAVAQEGVRRELAIHVTDLKDLAAGRPRWRKFVGVADEVIALDGWKDELYLLSRHGASRGRVLLVKASAPELAHSRVAVREGDSAIEALALARDALYLRTMVGGVDRLEKLPLGLLAPKTPEFVRLPFDNAITQLLAHPQRPGAIVRLQGWIEAPAILEVEAKSGNLRNTRLQPESNLDFSSMDEVRLYASAEDGTKIPVTLVYRKTTRLTGDNPTLLAVYGSYGDAFRPTFDAARLAWLERGGIFAVAHVRGGGEYGEDWHEAGRRARKATSVGDFIAVAEFLQRYGFTQPRRLAILATGPGGIPAAGAIARRPDLLEAAVLRAPLVDMLRYERMPGGGADVAEYGSAATPEGVEALRRISAYHQVKDGSAYPAVLLTASTNDWPAAAWQAAKMAARLQSTTASGKPVLLRVDAGAPGARAQREDDLADVYSFVLWRLGDPEFQVPPPVAPAPAPAPSATPAPAPAPAIR